MLVVESCDFWSTPSMWQAIIVKRPKWRPLLGFYDSRQDYVTDAHITMLRSHGVAAIQSCWYRSKTDPDDGADDGFIRSLTQRPNRRSAIPWFLLWDNVNPVGAPARSPGDFLEHVGKVWLRTDFLRSDYFRIDGKPLVTIANAASFADQLGGTDAARIALLALRRMAVAVGLPGLIILTTNNARQTDDEILPRDIGFDAVSMYATPTFTGLLRSTSPSDAAVIRAERLSWRLAADHSRLPTLVTASVGFDARLWSDSSMHFLLSAKHWRSLLHSAVGTARQRPADSLGGRIVLLDALNEFGEGHFIEPTVAFGTAYLDSVRMVAIEEGISR